MVGGWFVLKGVWSQQSMHCLMDCTLTWYNVHTINIKCKYSQHIFCSAWIAVQRVTCPWTLMVVCLCMCVCACIHGCARACVLVHACWRKFWTKHPGTSHNLQFFALACKIQKASPLQMSAELYVDYQFSSCWET